MLDTVIKWFHRKPIRRQFAKRRLLRLSKKYHRLNIKWQHDRTNMHIATLKLIKAKLEYCRSCFEPWGKYRPECSYDNLQAKAYNKEAELLGLSKLMET